ncbi:uncharacterized protein [Miscanthus floridulus]|uniref:uncharacterized protein n=1 Tax=Miscanthus floridulus TaxID=154761 RepID=UPI003459E1B5
MSQPQPTSSFPPPPPTSTAPLQSAGSEVSDGSTTYAAPLTLESLAATILDINRNIASMQAAWAGLVQQPSPPSFSTSPPSTGVPSVSSQPLLPPSSFPYGMPVSGPGVPLHLLRWPASPSPIPSWADGLGRSFRSTPTPPPSLQSAACARDVGTRLVELARLPFLSTVQDYSERYNAVLCHARDLSPRQKAELYVGGLSDQIKVHVEMRTPRDLQSAMYLARAFERCVAVPAPPAPQWGNRPPQRQGLPPLPRASGAAPVPGGAAPGARCPLQQLGQQLPTRRLCVRSAASPRRRWLSAADKGFVLIVTSLMFAATSASAWIRPANSMLVPVTIKGERFLALLDTGSTHNFLKGAAMRRLGLSPSGGEDLRVTVANGDRLACAGIARDVPIRIADEDFIITCVGLDLGGFDFILRFDFLRTLGPILWDCSALTMAFWRDGRRVTWQGVGGSATPTDQQRSAAAAVTADPTLPLLDNLLQQHGAIFDEPHALPPARPYDHRIHLLPGTAPMAVRPYRYPQLQKDELERQCAEMLAQGIIRPSTSPFSAPVLLVRKLDKSWRFCIDYRALNAKIRQGQVRMHPDDAAKTAFLHAPWPLRVFGDACSFLLGRTPTTCQHRPPRPASAQPPPQALQVLLRRCVRGLFRPCYLQGRSGHGRGQGRDGSCVADPYAPARGLRGFLGLTGYYRKFIKDFGIIAAPLTRLLRRDTFAWDDDVTTAFEALKAAHTTGPVLQMPDFDRLFVVDCDASGAGFVAVLHQGAGPLAYFSRPFAVCHLKLAAYERELIGLVQAVRHWRPYLWGRHFLVRIDHYSLKFLLDQRLSTVPQHQWLSKLFGFDFAVEYRLGRLNTVADALSRRDAEAVDATAGAGAARAISGPSFAFLDAVRSATAAAPDAAAAAPPARGRLGSAVARGRRVAAAWPTYLRTRRR